MANPEPAPPGSALGDRLQDFRPMTATVIAGFILSVLLVAGGLAAIGFPLRSAVRAGGDLPFAAEKQMSWLVVGFLSLLGIGLTVGGAALAVFSRGLISRRVEVCVNGFRHCSRRSVEEVLWTDVALIRENIVYERYPILKGPAKLLLPKVASTSYWVITTGGKEYRFDGDSIKGIKRFGKILRQQADRLSLPWETVEDHG
jgi:hypothetical protein